MRLIEDIRLTNERFKEIDRLHNKSRAAETGQYGLVDCTWNLLIEVGKCCEECMASEGTGKQPTSSGNVDESLPDKSWTVNQLRDYLRKRNGRLTGRKNDLLHL